MLIGRCLAHLLQPINTNKTQSFLYIHIFVNSYYRSLLTRAKAD